MSDSLKLYRNIAEYVCKNGMRFHDLRCLSTFLWAMVGMLQSNTIHLSEWSLHRKGETQAASKQRTLSRWLENALIIPATLFEPLAEKMCAVFAGERVYVALDSSVLWERFVIVQIVLVYRARALPLSWVVLAGQSASVAFEKYQEILDRAVKILPKSCEVILLADRGFGDRKLFKKALALGWGFRIRLKTSVWVGHHHRRRAKIGALMPAKGHALFLQHVWLTDHWFGPVHLALAYVQTAKGFEKWAVVSDVPTSLKTFDEFGLRFDIEENFLDDKSAGFQLESSEIRGEQALARLILILAVSTFYVVCCGVQAADTDTQRHKVDAHWLRGLSFLQIGWRWLFHALANDLLLPVNLHLLSKDDFGTVIASKKQAARPIATLYGLSCLP